MLKSRRTWFLCLLLLGTVHLSGAVAETPKGYSALGQTVNSAQDAGDKDKDKNKDKDKDKNKDKDKDKGKGESGQNGKTPDPAQDDGNKGGEDKGGGKDNGNGKDKDKGKGEDKDKEKDKGQDGKAPDDGGDKSAATPENALENAAVATATSVLPNPVGRGSSGDGRYFVGEVSVNDGSSVLIGSTPLAGDLRWLSVLRAGMWAEAHGHWENDVFVADDVKVLEADDWAYYRGPAAALGVNAEGTVEAWTADGSEAFEGIRTAPGEGGAVRLVAFFDGQDLVAVPPTFPPPTGAAVGWTELKGYFDGAKVVWESAAPFP